jgi:5'-nucleotidase
MKTARLAAALLVAAYVSFGAAAAQQPRPYRILVTNDDGVHAPGLAAVAQVLQAIGDVSIVAPSSNQTASSQSLNTIQPIFREDLTLPNGLRAVGLTATPATTVQVGIKNILSPRPDLVVSGINPGLNLGFSAYLSGTVGAARQAVMEGVPAIAASMSAEAAPRDYVAAAEEVLGVARRVKEHGLPELIVLNVNIPAMPAGGYKGYRVTSAARMRAGTETFAEATHPTGRTLYWSVYKEGGEAPAGTDAWAVQNGYVAVTPLRADESDAGLAGRLADWFR